MKKNVEMTAQEKLAAKTESWLGKNSKLILIVLIALAVIVAAVGIGYAVSNSNTNKTWEGLYEVSAAYNKVASLDETTAEYTEAKNAFLDKAGAFGAKNKIGTYPGAKTEMLVADLSFLEEDWDAAYKGYLAVADANKDNYLGSLNYTNAAACAENLGDNDEALRLYELVWDTYGKAAAEAPKALFGQGRIQLANGNKDLAYSIFEQLAGEFPQSMYSAIAESMLAMN